MNKDFTIIFDKLEEHAYTEELGQQDPVVVLANESLVELDELAELRRIVIEISDPEPLCFTTA